MKILNLLLLFLMTSTFAADFKEPKGQSFVAWKTRKRMFLFKEVKPVGINKDINIKKSGGDFTIIVPKKSFDSGDQDRDDEVVIILNGKKHPTINFYFSLSQNQLINIKLGTVKTISGQLDANGKKVDVKFDIENLDNALKVKYIGKFSDFDIEPPKVAGGAVAKVYDELELFGVILFSDLMI